MEPVVRVRDLRMRYGDNDVLTGVDFDIARARSSACSAPTARARRRRSRSSRGFRIRSAGEVVVLGQDPAVGRRGLAGAHRCGPPVVARPPAVDAAPAADPAGRLLRSLLDPRAAAPHDIDLLLETVGLADLADRKIATLSGGQRRRLDVAVGIVGRPELLFLDEPTAGFDPQARREFHGLVRNLAASEGRRSCSRPTTSTRPRSSPTGCSSSPPGGSSPTTPSTGSPAGSRGSRR